MKEIIKIVKQVPIPKTPLLDLSTLPDIKHAEICEHIEEGLTVIQSNKALAGYALVAWNMDGVISTAYWAARGPIGRSMVPALVHDVLLKRIAITEVKEDLEDEGRISR